MQVITLGQHGKVNGGQLGSLDSARGSSGHVPQVAGMAPIGSESAPLAQTSNDFDEVHVCLDASPTLLLNLPYIFILYVPCKEVEHGVSLSEAVNVDRMLLHDAKQLLDQGDLVWHLNGQQVELSTNERRRHGCCRSSVTRATWTGLCLAAGSMTRTLEHQSWYVNHTYLLLMSMLPQKK